MKKLLKVIGLLTLSCGVYAADYIIPQANNGQTPADANLVGVDVITATGTGNNYGITAPVFLHWVFISSVAAVGDFITLRDSGTLNSTSAKKLTIVPYVSTSTAISFWTFNPPIIFRNGMSITLNAVNGRWNFGYRRKYDGDIGNDASISTTVVTSASD